MSRVTSGFNLGATAEMERAINALNLDYARAIDEDELELWPHFFVEPCLYKVQSRTDYELQRPACLMLCDSRGMLLDRVSAIRKVNVFEPHRYRHIVAPSKILSTAADCVKTYTAYMVVRITQNGPMDLFNVGAYRDEILFVDGAPKLRTRIVVCDSETIDTLLSLPI